MPLNVAIFGSCVSRDAVGFAPEALTPAHYTARQSWVSALSPACWAPPLARLSSPFQRRMVRNDFHSSLFKSLAEQAPSADLVLLDIVDDRLGVIEYFPRRFITLSTELSDSGLLTGDRFLRRRRLHLGEVEHLRRFTLAAERVKSELMRAEAWKKTLLIRATWATESIEGDRLVGERGFSPEQWNAMYTPYYDMLDSLGFPIIEPAADLLFSTRQHQWGPHPIHYEKSASLELVSQILDRFTRPSQDYDQ